MENLKYNILVKKSKCDRKKVHNKQKHKQNNYKYLLSKESTWMIKFIKICNGKNDNNQYNQNKMHSIIDSNVVNNNVI